MTTFIEAVADAYLAQTDVPLDRCCFVLPSRRAATFLTHAFARRHRGSSLGPSVMTMPDWVSSITRLRRPSRPEALFLLYRANRELDPETPFERFRFWGETVLNDFDDVDANLCDTAELFRNVSEYREIASDYLTEEQKAVVARYWPNFTPALAVSGGRMWRHTLEPGADSPLSANFGRLWNSLQPLYTAFRGALLSRGLATDGMALRRAVEIVSADGFELPHGWQRVVFVGFGDLSLAELEIFGLLQDRGLADFYFDTSSPFFDIEGCPAGRYVRRWAEQLPSRLEVTPGSPEKITVDVVGCPSATAQARLVAERLEALHEAGHLDAADALNTAVVLPDQELMVTVANNLPARFSTINITMGIPMRTTPVAMLLHRVLQLLTGARRSGGVVCLRRDRLSDLAADPLLSVMNPDECLALRKCVDSNRRFVIPAALCLEAAPALGLLLDPGPFMPGSSEGLDALAARITEIADFIGGALVDPAEFEDDFAAEAAPDVEAEREARETRLRFLMARAVKKALMLIIDAARRTDMTGSLRPDTFTSMFQSLIAAEQVHFEGQPVRGLQVMGVQETRALDFDNIIFTSMNDRVMPARLQRATFIPEVLRRAYGLTTFERREAAAAYDFYRLLGRAARVTLLYDSRSGLRGGAVSRYVSQMLLLAPESRVTVTHTGRSFRPIQIAQPLLEVRKDPGVMEALAEFSRAGDDGRDVRRFSASALNTYLSCPLKFYLSQVEHLHLDEEQDEAMDASTYGSIVHNTLEALYRSLRRDPDNRDEAVNVSAADIDRLIAEAPREVQHQINIDFCRAVPDAPLSGEALIMADIITRVVREMLSIEKEHAPFRFVDAERRVNVTLGSQQRPANFTMIIDRIDDLADGTRRLVDYKTGSDETAASNLEILFTPKDKRPKAVFQILLYAYASRVAHIDAGRPLQPVIIRLRDVFQGREAVHVVKLGQETLESIPSVVLDEFGEHLNSLFDEIFDPEKPFVKTPGCGGCHYCSFKVVCGEKEDSFN